MIKEGPFYQELGRRLHARRKAVPMTQENLAKEVGMTRTSITNIEKGRQKVLAHVLVELAEALNVPMGELLPKRDAVAEAVESLTPADREWFRATVRPGEKP